MEDFFPLLVSNRRVVAKAIVPLPRVLNRFLGNKPHPSPILDRSNSNSSLIDYRQYYFCMTSQCGVTRLESSTRTILLVPSILASTNIVHAGTCVEIQLQANKVSVKMSRRLLLCALALVLLRDCWGLDNGLALTPPSKLPGKLRKVSGVVEGFHESDGALAFL